MSFFKKYKDRMIVTAVAIILIIMIGVTSSERMNITSFESALGNILSPVEKFFFSVGESVSEFFSSVSNISNIKEENEQLKKRVAILEEENRRYEDIIAKSDFLEKEAKLKQNSKYKLIDAKITGKDPGNWFDRFIIDKGVKDGIKKGDIVIQGVEVEKDVVQEGIVGRIIDVGDDWAKVVSIVDEGSNAAFKVIRTQDGGILSGSIDSELNGYLFDSKSDVIKGDKLYTSGLGGLYVEDLYIGEISEVIKKDEDLMKRIIVTPVVNFKKLYKVYVISK